MPRLQSNSTRHGRRASPNPYYLGSNGVMFCCQLQEGGFGHDLVTGTWGLGSANVKTASTPFGVKSLVFNGSDTFVDFLYNRLWTASNSQKPGYSHDCSICCWAKFTSAAASQICMEFGADTNSSVMFGFGLNSSARLSNMQTNDFYGASTFTPSTGTWYRLAMIRNAAAQTVDYYVNGFLHSTGNFTQGFTGTLGLTLTLGTRGTSTPGTTSGRGLHFNGELADIRIYPYQLSPGMVWADFAPGQTERLRGKLRSPVAKIVASDIPLNERMMLSMP